jgi:hypothetical protein
MVDGPSQGGSLETIDRRSRFDRDAAALSVDAFLDQQLPDLLERHGALAGRGLRQLGLPPLGLDVDGGKHTLTVQLEEAHKLQNQAPSPVAVPGATP